MSESIFASTVTRYLEYNRALGRKYRGEAFVLSSLQRHIEQCGCDDLDAKCFESWMLALKTHANTRRRCYLTVRLFCVYRRRSNPDFFLPPAEGAPKRQPYVTPIILEPQQVARIIRMASELPRMNRSPLREGVLRLAVVLLYTCGLRLGELLRLTVSDIEESQTVLRIRESKFYKSRLVPLSPSTTVELQRYLQLRHERFPGHSHGPLLCNRTDGHVHAYTATGLNIAIKLILDKAGIRDSQGRLPRVHDFRHHSERPIIPSGD